MHCQLCTEIYINICIYIYTLILYLLFTKKQNNKTTPFYLSFKIIELIFKYKFTYFE